MTNGSLADLLTLYGIVFEALRHESNGIWQRFDTALGMNLALFAGFGFVCFGESRPVNWRAFGIAIAVGGALTIRVVLPRLAATLGAPLALAESLGGNPAEFPGRLGAANRYNQAIHSHSHGALFLDMRDRLARGCGGIGGLSRCIQDSMTSKRRVDRPTRRRKRHGWPNKPVNLTGGVIRLGRSHSAHPLL